MTREAVRKMMFSAKTLSECETAWAAHAAYLRAHPEDEEWLLDASETLYMREQGLKQRSARERLAGRVA